MFCQLHYNQWRTSQQLTFLWASMVSALVKGLSLSTASSGKKKKKCVSMETAVVPGRVCFCWLRSPQLCVCILPWLQAGTALRERRKEGRQTAVSDPQPNSQSVRDTCVSVGCLVKKSWVEGVPPGRPTVACLLVACKAVYHVHWCWELLARSDSRESCSSPDGQGFFIVSWCGTTSPMSCLCPKQEARRQ